MNPKYTTAGLALGILVALGPETALAQNSKPQVHQKASTRSAPSTPRITDSNLSNLPIGVLQGIEDAKRYQELVRRAERLGQPIPPLPYTTSTPRPTAISPAASPAAAGYVSSPSVPTAPSQPATPYSPNSAMNPYQPGMVPMASVPASPSQPMQYLQSPQMGPVRTDLTFGQVRPQPATPQPYEVNQNLREHIEALYEILGNFSGAGGSSMPDYVPVQAPSTPSHQPISMPGPAPTHLPFDRRP